jgi:membrane-bound lytic murein transglycosylase D
MQQRTNERDIAIGAWLIQESGAYAGRRFAIPSVARVGRALDNEIVVSGPEAVTVSSRHLEISLIEGQYRLRDLGSTNGTFVNGVQVQEVELRAGDRIQLGTVGPVLAFHPGEAGIHSLNETVVVPRDAVPVPAPVSSSADAPEDGKSAKRADDLKEAVRKARLARQGGQHNQTMEIMRHMLDSVVRRSHRKFKAAIVILLVALTSVSLFAYFRIQEIQAEKSGIDEAIRDIEERIAAAGQDPEQLDDLVESLTRYQDQAKNLQSDLLYRLGVRDRQHDFLEAEIHALLEEFGAEVYSVPPQFVNEVSNHVRRYQTADRPHMQRALSTTRGQLRTIQGILVRNNLPADLAYIPLVESALIGTGTSPAGAAGLWQFTAATARQYGLRVGEGVDERLDARKSTEAACRYIRELILDFGSGSSVMLALAAYNVGPGRVKQAIRRVENPIRQRNFWYLYNVRALPPETRQYVPKVFAAMIIGRSPEKFGFQK